MSMEEYENIKKELEETKEKLEQAEEELEQYKDVCDIEIEEPEPVDESIYEKNNTFVTSKVSDRSFLDWLLNEETNPEIISEIADTEKLNYWWLEYQGIKKADYKTLKAIVDNFNSLNSQNSINDFVLNYYLLFEKPARVKVIKSMLVPPVNAADVEHILKKWRLTDRILSKDVPFGNIPLLEKKHALTIADIMATQKWKQHDFNRLKTQQQSSLIEFINGLSVDKKMNLTDASKKQIYDRLLMLKSRNAPSRRGGSTNNNKWCIAAGFVLIGVSSFFPR
ncbi:hypothetical protein TetV_492 [Tetraselmis virus 1]|uniref:Uncharacterized protein n=1 Tax=Tetraselmis virus 1 TaxID=2060617 RepID=A0A2P0VNU3_9VIRU|nr:hypothetical protein QJ968_gp562 [Tetraselmis virus 1]AUF82574.1 hypothetical protein TetV_492 [Tetraselmis virus 1]